MKAALKGRLVLIEHCDFRCSEWTNLNVVLKKNKMKLGPQDVVAMVSGNGKQIVFAYAHDQFKYEDYRGDTRPAGVVQSLRYRLTGNGVWSPTMLATYAEAVGIDLIGLKKFEQYYRAIKVKAATAKGKKG